MGPQIPRGLHSEMSQEALYVELQRHLGEVFRKLRNTERIPIEEGV